MHKAGRSHTRHGVATPQTLGPLELTQRTAAGLAQLAAVGRVLHARAIVVLPLAVAALGPALLVYVAGNALGEKQWAEARYAQGGSTEHARLTHVWHASKPCYGMSRSMHPSNKLLLTSHTGGGSDESIQLQQGQGFGASR